MRVFLNYRARNSIMFRGMALLLCFVALVDVYMLDGRHVNAALQIWERIAHFNGL
jgi:hypothetical protein